MDVAGRTHGLAVLLSERDNPTVVVFQILDGLRLISEVSILVIFRNGQKHVVADRLDFQIVIEIHNPLQFLLRGAALDRLEQLAGLTGRPDDQSVPVRLEKALRQMRLPVRDILQMRLRHAAVQVDTARLILCQKNDMVGRHLPDLVLVRSAVLVDLVKVMEIQILQHADKLHEDVCRTLRVIDCPMMVPEVDVQCLCNRVQLVFSEVRQQDARQRHGIHRCEIMIIPQTPAVFFDEADIKGGIVRNQHTVLRKCEKSWQDLFYRGRIRNHRIVDRGQILDPQRNRDKRVYKLGEAVHDLPAADLDRTDLDDPVLDRRKSGCLEIENHKIALQGLASRVDSRLHQVIHQVSLAPVDDLEIGILRDRLVSVRKPLHNAMVRDRDRLVSPGGCRLHQIARLRHGIHRTHLGMAV